MGIALHISTSSAGRCEPACPAVRVAPGGALPFDATELARLVRLRLRDTPGCACPTVDVTSGDAPGLVVLTCPDRRADVSIGDLTGEDAAREVAIVLADILLAPPAPPPQQQLPPPAIAVAGRSGPAPAPVSRWSFWAAPGIAWSTSAGAAFEPHAGAGRSLHGPWGVLVDVGFAQASATAPKLPVTADLQMVPVRAGGALTIGPWRFSGGVALRGYRAQAASSDTGVRFGGFVSADWVFRRWAPLDPYLAAGLDLYARKLDVRVDGVSTLTGDHLAPWIALGILWSGARP
jgi:hypothetical protein